MIDEIYKTGVYAIKNIVNEKFYIGSTTQSFYKRRQQHFYELEKGKHKNSYLQNSYNKYGKENFVFEIIEICEKNVCLEKEQFYIDTLHPNFNINPLASGTPNLSKETIIKRSLTFKKTYNECLEFYRNLKSGKITIVDVSDKCKK